MSASVEPADRLENRTTTGGATRGVVRVRIRNGAIGLGMLAAAFYLGFIALLVFRSHH